MMKMTEQSKPLLIKYILTTIEGLSEFANLLMAEELTKEDLEDLHMSVLEYQDIIESILKLYFSFDKSFFTEVEAQYWKLIDSIYERNAELLSFDAIDKIEWEGKCLVCGEEIEFDEYGIARCEKCGTYYYGFYDEDGIFYKMYMKKND